MNSHKNFDWLIVGGGIHGVHIAARILESLNNPQPKIGIIDPWPSLMYRWHQCTSATGMSHLRSPAVHNLAIDPFDLQKFAGKRARYKQVYFKQPYSRPSTKFFKKHSDLVIEKYKLDDFHIKAKVEKIHLSGDHVAMETTGGLNLEAKKGVLALGSSERLNIPDWALNKPNFYHIFSEDFVWPNNNGGEGLIIVGGGITAIQAALYASDLGFKVHMVARHELRQHQFDSDPGWLGPKYMSGFLKEKCYKVRRSMIARARHRGSAPQELVVSIRKRIAEGKIAFHKANIEKAESSEQGVTLYCDHDTEVNAQKVLLATGFKKDRPGGQLIDHLLSDYCLPTAACHYPILGSDLRWHPHLFVSGPLAELEIGPTARNISGARSAAKRILGF